MLRDVERPETSPLMALPIPLHPSHAEALRRENYFPLQRFVSSTGGISGR